MKTLIIAHVYRLTFHKDLYKHTIDYAKRGQDLSCCSEATLLDNIRSTVGNNITQVSDQLSQEVREFLSRRGLDPADFSFEFQYGQTENGMFWPASTFSGIVRIK